MSDEVQKQEVPSAGLNEALKSQFSDLVFALVILVKEALLALAVLGIGHLIGWCIRFFSSDGEFTANLVRNISDVGAVILFVIFVGKDLWNYVSRK